MKKSLNEDLCINDTIEVNGVTYKCISEESICLNCDLINTSWDICDGIGCIKNSIILKIDTTPKYPVLLVAGESIEILGLKLLIKSEIGETEETEEANECSGCVLNSRTAFVLCKQVDCETNGVIISEEVVE